MFVREEKMFLGLQSLGVCKELEEKVNRMRGAASECGHWLSHKHT